MRKVFLFLVIFITFSVGVMGAGSCVLDKKTYNYAENAILKCQCGAANEENSDGYIVFLKSDGTVLSSQAINSGNCITEVFTAEYSFYVGGGFEGNATFAKNADGTEAPAGWTNPVADIPWDGFNKTYPAPTDCFIKIENTTKNTYDLGTTMAGSFQLLDPSTNWTITEGECTTHIKCLENGATLLNFPEGSIYGDVYDNIYTGATGKGYYQHMLAERFFEKNKEYVIEINCYARPRTYYIGNNTNYSNGTMFKECENHFVFWTGKDYREPECCSIYPIIFVQVFFIIYLTVMGFVFLQKHKKSDKSKHYNWRAYSLGCYIIGLLEFILTFYILYLHESLGNKRDLLHTNWFLLALVGTYLIIYIMVDYFRERFDPKFD